MWEYVDVNTLYVDIESDPALKSLKFKTMGLICTMFCGGSDYTDGYKFVPYKHFLSAILTETDNIGELVKITRPIDKEREPYDISIDGCALVTLVLMAYKRAFSNRIPEYEDVTTETINEFLDGSNGRKPLARTKYFPCLDDFKLAALQISYYLRLAYQLGNANMREPDPMIYGYELVCPDLPVSRNNLRRKIIPTDPNDP